MEPKMVSPPEKLLKTWADFYVNQNVQVQMVDRDTGEESWGEAWVWALVYLNDPMDIQHMEVRWSPDGTGCLMIITTTS